MYWEKMTAVATKFSVPADPMGGLNYGERIAACVICPCSCLLRRDQRSATQIARFVANQAERWPCVPLSRSYASSVVSAMSAAPINLVSISPKKDVDGFDASMEFTIALDVAVALDHPVDIVVSWLGSTTTAAKDVILEELEVGPLAVGRTSFVVECDPPRLSKLPPAEILGNTALFVSFKYKGDEFLLVSFLVHVGFRTELLELNPPDVLTAGVLKRALLTRKTNVVRRVIDWGLADAAAPPASENTPAASVHQETAANSGTETAAAAEEPQRAASAADATVSSDRKRQRE